jgi:hypothetical protein
MFGTHSTSFGIHGDYSGRLIALAERLVGNLLDAAPYMLVPRLQSADVPAGVATDTPSVAINFSIPGGHHVSELAV